MFTFAFRLHSCSYIPGVFIKKEDAWEAGANGGIAILTRPLRAGGFHVGDCSLLGESYFYEL